MNKPGIANECENGTNDACWTVETFRHSSGAGDLTEYQAAGRSYARGKGTCILTAFFVKRQRPDLLPERSVR